MTYYSLTQIRSTTYFVLNLKKKIANSADIEKMFYQFSIYEEQRDFFRFLWWKDGDVTSEPIQYRMNVHVFRAVSSPGCANFGSETCR